MTNSIEEREKELYPNEKVLFEEIKNIIKLAIIDNPKYMPIKRIIEEVEIIFTLDRYKYLNSLKELAIKWTIDNKF